MHDSMCPSPLPLHISDLDYQYPESLVAKAPSPNSRVLISRPKLAPQELSLQGLLELFEAGDLLVINDTKVEKRRVFTEEGYEVLFVTAEESGKIWQVLFPARKLKLGARLNFPGGRSAELIAKGKPQKLEFDSPIDGSYFEQFGEMPLPPYIQQARGERHNRTEDQQWYQTAWARVSGSQAAPTASLHFKQSDLDFLKSRGVSIQSLTLHVGLGTFLPIQVDDLDQHEMHREHFSLSKEFIDCLNTARSRGGRVWALGTTSTRALESFAGQKGQWLPDGSYTGETDLFIRPGYEFHYVDVLLTNFHQPRSTLLALVAAFAGLERVMSAYQWAISNEFRLFSYGDLSVWLKE